MADLTLTLCVDRVEDGTVILLDETEHKYWIPLRALDFVPHDGAILHITTDSDGVFMHAEYDAEATEARRAAVRERSRQLFGYSAPSDDIL